MPAPTEHVAEGAGEQGDGVEWVGRVEGDLDDAEPGVDKCGADGSASAGGGRAGWRRAGIRQPEIQVHSACSAMRARPAAAASGSVWGAAEGVDGLGVEAAERGADEVDVRGGGMDDDLMCR